MSTAFAGSTKIYGVPVDSVAPGIPGLSPKYWFHSSVEIHTDYEWFSSGFRTRGGSRYLVRRDLGYLRIISVNLILPNLEMVQWSEYLERSAQRAECIYPYWPAYTTISSHSSTSVVGVSLEDDWSVGDYVLLLSKDYSFYSIRAISSGDLLTGAITLDSAPEHSFSSGDILCPMLTGYQKGDVRCRFRNTRDFKRLSFQLKEFQAQQDRSFIE